jgi:hypothetical protein
LGSAADGLSHTNAPGASGRFMVTAEMPRQQCAAKEATLRRARRGGEREEAAAAEAEEG